MRRRRPKRSTRVARAIERQRVLSAAERDHRDIIDHIARNLARNLDEELFQQLSRP